ncbi:MAG TPA: FadR/GntR family transcriptional regulator [Geminicoccaceae bacterium]|nr:FadR/GntR family transcriptional regulator [Geminicoccus sp.]HMU52095.1 FadR/GntR family transcriptional regulator [Geminicoccaceae bacterium]
MRPAEAFAADADEGPGPGGAIEVTPAPRRRLADILYGQLLKQIVDKEMPEDSRLPSEAEIARMFGASRPVVREALMRLQVDGLVYSRKGAGTFVRTRPPPRLTEFADPSLVASYLRCNEVRIGLETEAARLAAKRRSQSQLDAIREAADALHRAFAHSRVGEAEDLAFHRAVAEASGNEFFPHLLGELAELMRGSMMMGLGLTRAGSEPRRQQVLREHREIVEAIGARDADAAALFMRVHLVQSRLRTTDARIGQ